MFTKYITAAFAGVVLLSATSAGALTMTQNISISDFAPDSPSINTFSAYNGAGTLTSAKLSWNIATSANIWVDFCADTGDCGPGTFLLSLSGTGAMASLPSASDLHVAGVNGGIDTDQNLAYDNLLNGMFAFANLGDFIGAGLVAGSIDIDGAYGTNQLGPQWNGYFKPECDDIGAPCSSHDRDGLLTLTYEINEPTTAVPEPGMLGLFGLGLVGLAYTRRRKVA